MVQDDPAKRPTMDEVVRQFVEIRRNLSDRKLRSRMTSRKESILHATRQNLVHWVQSLRYRFQGLPAVPSRRVSEPTVSVRPVLITLSPVPLQS